MSFDRDDDEWREREQLERAKAATAERDAELVRSAKAEERARLVAVVAKLRTDTDNPVLEGAYTRVLSEMGAEEGGEGA